MARTTTEHVIVVQAADPANGPVRLEYLAGEANITPGELLEVTTANAVLRHNSAGGHVGVKLVADISQTPDTATYPTTAKIDIDYANGDTVYVIAGSPGDVLNMILATSQTAVIGSPLISDGDGALTVASVGTSTLEGAVVGHAVEAVTTTSAVARIKVRIV